MGGSRREGSANRPAEFKNPGTGENRCWAPEGTQLCQRPARMAICCRRPGRLCGFAHGRTSGRVPLYRGSRLKRIGTVPGAAAGRVARSLRASSRSPRATWPSRFRGRRGFEPTGEAQTRRATGCKSGRYGKLRLGGGSCGSRHRVRDCARRPGRGLRIVARGRECPLGDRRDHSLPLILCACVHGSYRREGPPLCAARRPVPGSLAPRSEPGGPLATVTFGAAMDVDGVQRSLPVASIGEPAAFWTENLLGDARGDGDGGVAAAGMVTGWERADKGYC